MCVIWHSGVRSWRRKISSFINSLRVGVFPASLSSLSVSVGFYNAMYLNRDTHNHCVDLSFGLLNFLMKHVRLEEPAKGVVCCSASGFALWCVGVMAMKYSLRMLYLYKGWMYEDRGPDSRLSIYTRYWTRAVKTLTYFSHPMLYSY